MDFLDRVNTLAVRGRSAAPERKSWGQPDFWSVDHARNPLLTNMSVWGTEEQLEHDFGVYIEQIFKKDGPIAACIVARMMVFSEARFAFRSLTSGGPGELTGGNSPDLELLRHPWQGAGTGDLLARMELDASLAGNFYATTVDNAGKMGKAATGPGRRIAVMRPDWVTLIISSASGDPRALDAQVVGYRYQPLLSSGGHPGGSVLLMADEVCHYAPLPDPGARYRGMSWLTPILEDIQADKAATRHKSRFFVNGANPNFAVVFDKETSEDDFESFTTLFREAHQGAENAYKTLFLAGGADIKALGADFKQLEFAQTQGKGEARIASMSGVPSSWVGFSEGLQGSSLNANNFSAGRRRFADGTIKPLWRLAAGSLATLIKEPSDSELWVDTRDVAFLREEAKDRAEIFRIQMSSVDAGIKSGWDPDAAIDAALAEDIGVLRGTHTGYISVQMQPPGDPEASDDDDSEGGRRQGGGRSEADPHEPGAPRISSDGEGSDRSDTDKSRYPGWVQLPSRRDGETKDG